MSDKTIPEIHDAYGEESAARLSEWYAKTDEVAGRREPEGGELLEYMDAKGRDKLLRDQMEATLEEERAPRIEEAQAKFDAFRRDHDERVAWLEARLYHVEGADHMVANAVMASDDELARLLDGAIRTSSDDLARVVFAEAQSRNL